MERFQYTEQALRPRPKSVPDVRLGAVAITSQAQTFTLADAVGQAIIPFVSWQDNCAGSASAAVAESAGMDEFPGHSSFAELLPALQIAQLRRLRDEQPARLRAAHRVLHLPTFLVQAFTGKAVIDDNLAAMSGLFSLKLNDWWPAALTAAGVSRAQLPEVIPIGHCAGVTTSSAAAFGLPPGLPVVPAGCHGLIFDAGLPADTWAWRNIGMHHRPADLARSVLESLCQRMEQMIRQLAVPLPPRNGHILAAGGGGASPLWLEMLTHRLGCAVRRTDCTPLRGAAALAHARPRGPRRNSKVPPALCGQRRERRMVSTV